MRVSFVIPSHNNAAWLPHAVESCLKQTHKDIEVVIVDDASTDSTQELFDYYSSLRDPRLKLITNKSNKGRSASRNLGNQAATGEIICVLDSDDLSLARRAELMVKNFKDGVQFLHGGAEVIDPVGTLLNTLAPQSVTIDLLTEGDMHSGIVHSTVAYTKSIAMKYPYREGEPDRLGFDDWDQQIRILADSIKIDFVPFLVSNYRALETGITFTRKVSEVPGAKKKILSDLKIEVASAV
jgi:glycosyltransferase involved in cell wall biosynthesis